MKTVNISGASVQLSNEELGVMIQALKRHHTWLGLMDIAYGKKGSEKLREGNTKDRVMINGILNKLGELHNGQR